MVIHALQLKEFIITILYSIKVEPIVVLLAAEPMKLAQVQSWRQNIASILIWAQLG